MFSNHKALSDQTIVITGASSGIGLATAYRAADAGANVVLSARNAEALADAARSIESRGGEAAWVAVDIGEPDAAERIGACAQERFGGFDSWVNNAAAAMFAPLLKTDMDEHRRIFDTGYFGLVSASQYAARKLKDRGGAIINVGSVLSERSVPIQGAYSAMKHAVAGFTEALRMELEAEDAPISVTLIKPNGMQTPYPEHAHSELDKPPRIPPVVYDPRLVAKAICHACAHPKRDITVGGQGLVLTKGGNIAPRLMDKVMETFFGESGQTDETPARPGMRDNLFEPRRDGRIDGNKDHYVRRTSLALEAQLHPWRTAAIAGGAALLGAAALKRRNHAHASGRPSFGSDRGSGDGARRGNGAHQPDGRDSSAQYQAGIADEQMVPERASSPA